MHTNRHISGTLIQTCARTLGLGILLTFLTACRDPVASITLSQANLSRSNIIDGTARAITYRAARGETIGFEFEVDGISEESLPLSISVDPPSSQAGALASGHFEFFRVHSAEGPGPAPQEIRFRGNRNNQGEALLVPVSAPIGGLNDQVEPSVRLWVDIRIPHDALPGFYSGSIRLESAGTPSSLPLLIHILPLELPRRHESAVVANLSLDKLALRHRWAEATPGRTRQALLSETLRNPAAMAGARAIAQKLRRHGVVPFFQDIRPDWSVDASGELRLDWSAYDLLVRTITQVDAPQVLQAYPLVAAPVAPQMILDKLGDDRALVAYYKEVATHFADSGIDALIPVKASATRGTTGVQSPLRQLKALVQAESSLPILWQPHPAASDARQDIVNQIQKLEFRGAQITEPWQWTGHSGRERSSRLENWLVAAGVPFSGSVHRGRDQAEMRSLFWQAWRMDCQKVWLDHSAMDPPTKDSETAVTGPAGAGVESPAPYIPGLLYSGKPFGLDEPVATLRLKWLRRGFTDYAYLTSLDLCGQRHVAEALASAMIKIWGKAALSGPSSASIRAGWPRDPSLWDSAVRIASENWASAVGIPMANSAGPNLRWRRLMESTNTLGVSIHGVRAAIDRQSEEVLTRIEVIASVRNHTRSVWSGSVRLTGIPELTEDMTGSRPIDNLGLGEEQRIRLEASMPWIPSNSDGRLPLLLEVLDAEGALQTVPLGGGMIRMAHLESRPILDGLPEFRNASAGNRMSSFAPVGFAGPFALSPSADAVAKKPTDEIWIARWEDELYVAWRVPGSTNPAQEPVHFYERGVQFDVPTGEDDALQVLLSPLNLGIEASAPGDVRILVRRAGGVEIGITDEQGGAKAAGLANVKMATRPAPGGWQGELVVPLSLLGTPQDEPRFIGVNAISYDAGRNQMNAWCFGSENPFVPVGFGNLFISGR